MMQHSAPQRNASDVIESLLPACPYWWQL